MNSDSKGLSLEQFGGELAQEGTCPLGPWFNCCQDRWGRSASRKGPRAQEQGARQWALDASARTWLRVALAGVGWGVGLGAWQGMHGLRSWPRARRGSWPLGPGGGFCHVVTRAPRPWGGVGQGVPRDWAHSRRSARLTPSGRDTEDATWEEEAGDGIGCTPTQNSRGAMVPPGLRRKG